ncbi:MAG TPA: ABC transporter substrate-binding protein, partial [Planctomycetota bacterium]|nr:ABC transporter substrate-binding protein [Planctomycetota bacterium]
AFIDSAGADNLQDRALVTFGGLPPEKLTGKGAAFVANYQKKYGKMPEGYAVYGFECGKTALEAIRRAGKKDRDTIRAAGVTIKNFDGALGKWSFDKNGDTTLRTMSGNTVKAGKFAFMSVLGED